MRIFIVSIERGKNNVQYKQVKQYSNMHDMYLENLVNNLQSIDESISNVKWIIKDGKWFVPNTNIQRKFCDLILIYDTYGVPVELKGSYVKKHKAMEQLRSGKQFILEELAPLKLTVPYAKFVVYQSKGFNTIIYEDL